MDFRYLRRLHKYIFGDIYDWAGEVRNVNINKGTMFCSHLFISQQAEYIFGQLKKEQYLTKCTEEKMPLRLAYYLSEINALHPFREGNGRTQRLFIEILAERAGYEVDFSEVSAEEMIQASADSFLLKYEKMNRLMQRIVKERNQTLVMVTHDNNLASYADRRIRIVDGRIVGIETGGRSALKEETSDGCRFDF